MIKSIPTIVLLILVLYTTKLAQKHPLPLQIKTINAEYVKDLFSETDYKELDNGEKLFDLIGYIYELKIDFAVEEPNFLKNPSFKIYMCDWDNEIQWIEIDSSLVTVKNNNSFSIKYYVDVGYPGWLNCYCLPSTFELHSLSLWDIIKGSDIKISVYLR